MATSQGSRKNKEIEKREIMRRPFDELFDNFRQDMEDTFFAPFIKYLPPLFSPYSWKIRTQVLKSVREKKFISYTGDRVERYALMIYRFNPIKAKRLPISATQVKEDIYAQALNKKEIKKSQWKEKIPFPVIRIIEENWNIVEKFAKKKDETLKIVGVKFPKKGFFN